MAKIGRTPIEEIEVLLRQIMPEGVKVKMLPDIAEWGYDSGTVGIIYLIHPIRKGGNNSKEDRGRVACFRVLSGGLTYELSTSYRSPWPILEPENNFYFQSAEIGQRIDEIRHFLVKGKFLSMDQHRLVLGADKGRASWIERAGKKKKELTHLFSVYIE